MNREAGDAIRLPQLKHCPDDDFAFGEHQVSPGDLLRWPVGLHWEVVEDNRLKQPHSQFSGLVDTSILNFLNGVLWPSSVEAMVADGGCYPSLYDGPVVTTDSV